MKKLIIILTIALLALPTFAQNKTTQTDNTATEQLLSSGAFTFVADRALTQLRSKPTVHLDGTYTLKISPEIIDCNLPFYGRGYTAPMDSARSPMSFTSKEFELKQSTAKKSERLKIDAKDDNSNNMYNLTLDVFPNGTATLHISNSTTSPMTYQGVIK